MNLEHLFERKDKKEMEDYYNELLNNLQNIDSVLDKKYEALKPEIIKQNEYLCLFIEDVLKNNYYQFCLRGVFGANIFDSVKKETVTETYFNKPAPGILNVCRFSDSQCTRSIIAKKHGLSYDTCPAGHARENTKLFITPTEEEQLFWVEGGAILINNRFQYWNINNLPNSLYPCVRCLDCSLLQKVNILAALNYNDGWGITFHSVQHHLELLLLKNTFAQME